MDKLDQCISELEEEVGNIKQLSKLVKEAKKYNEKLDSFGGMINKNIEEYNTKIGDTITDSLNKIDKEIKEIPVQLKNYLAESIDNSGDKIINETRAITSNLIKSNQDLLQIIESNNLSTLEESKKLTEIIKEQGNETIKHIESQINLLKNQLRQEKIIFAIGYIVLIALFVFLCK